MRVLRICQGLPTLLPGLCTDPMRALESQSCLNTVPIPAAPDMIPSVERVPAARLSHLDLSSSNDGAGTSQGVPHEDHLDLAY